jgi:hypothetical protein
MNNPKAQKNNSSKDIQKRLSGEVKNKNKEINRNQSNKDKKGQKFPSNVEKTKNMGLNKIPENNLRKSLKNPHVKNVDLEFQLNQKKQIRQNNQINQKSSYQNNQINPITYQSKYKNAIQKHFSEQNQIGKQNYSVNPNHIINQNQIGKQNHIANQNHIINQNQGGKQNRIINQNQNGKQNHIINQNQGGKQNHIINQNQKGKQNNILNQNQGGKKNHITNQNQNQEGMQIHGVKPIIKGKGSQNVGKELFNKDNNTKIKNNNAFNMNISSGENKIDFNNNNQPILRGKPTPKLPIEYVKLLSYKENTFYINSILYCLANNDKINKYLLDKFKKEEIDQPQRLVIYLFYRVIYHLVEKDISAYLLDKFYNYIIEPNPIFKDNHSKKLVGFLLFLLEQFHEEDKKLRNIGQNFKLNEEIYTNINKFENYLKFSEDTFVLNNYGWINEKIIKCFVCNKETITYSYYFTYDLNISSAISKYIIELASGNNENDQNLTIRKCLDYNINKEKIYNVYCKFCDKKTNLERQNLIHSINDNLIILLSGIEHGNIINLIRENNINIKVDKYLEINKNQYIINSVIYYNVKNNEYFNYCYKINVWIKYSNEGIKKLVNEDFLNKDNINIVPVVIFYSLNKKK